MTQRPDTLSVLKRSIEVAVEQVGRLEKAAEVSQAAADNSTTLTAADISLYKDISRTASKLVTAFGRITETELPSGKFSPAKRGRPPKARTEGEAAAPKQKRAPKAKAAAPKKAKAVKAAAPVVAVAPTADAPKRRGRPPKVKPATDVVAAEAPVAVAPKRRGRPPKVKPVVEVAESTNSVNVN